MKKGILTIAVLMVLLVVLFLPGCSGARVSELEAKVATLESEVATGNAAIAGLQGQITSLGQKIGELNEKLAVEKAKATGLQGMVTEKDGRIKSLSDNLTAKDGQIAALQTEVSSLKSLQAADPTYDGLMEFIKKDTTDKELSNFPVDFFAGAAQKFLENAVKAGIKGHYVRAQVKSGGPYSFTGFNTTDKGLIYILPTLDLVVKLEVGKRYSEINNQTAPFLDDTIMWIWVMP